MKSLVLTEKLMSNPTDSVLEVFRKFAAKLTTLKKRLDSNHHADKHLSERTMTAVDVLFIQVSLKDKVTRRAQQPANQIANR